MTFVFLIFFNDDSVTWLLPCCLYISKRTWLRCLSKSVICASLCFNAQRQCVISPLWTVLPGKLLALLLPWQRLLQCKLGLCDFLITEMLRRKKNTHSTAAPLLLLFLLLLLLLLLSLVKSPPAQDRGNGLSISAAAAAAAAAHKEQSTDVCSACAIKGALVVAEQPMTLDCSVLGVFFVLFCFFPAYFSPLNLLFTSQI